MIILKSIVLLRAISIFSLIIYMENVNCACPITDGNLNEILNNTCDWSSWLQWNCSTCYSHNGKASLPVRKRAICCEKGLDVPSCLQSCNYSKGSDTNYGNCSTNCASYLTTTTNTTTTTTATILATTTTSAAAVTTTSAAAAVTTTTLAAATTYRRATNVNMTDESLQNVSTNTEGPLTTTLILTSTLTSKGRPVPTGLILGVVAGCIAGLLIVAGVIVWSRKKFKSPVEPEPESIERPPEEDRIITGNDTSA